MVVVKFIGSVVWSPFEEGGFRRNFCGGPFLLINVFSFFGLSGLPKQAIKKL